MRIHNEEALQLPADAGAEVDTETRITRIPESIVRRALETAPSEFHLYDLHGEPVVDYGGDSVQFNPGSTAITILDRETQEPRPPLTEDFVESVKLVETIPQLDAQSTAMVCADVPEEIRDLYSQVHDLAVDVPAERFVAKLKETEADLLGLSTLLTTTMTIQREVIRTLVEAGIRNQDKVSVGGAPVSLEWADTIEADGYAEDALGAVELAKRLDRPRFCRK